MYHTVWRLVATYESIPADQSQKKLTLRGLNTRIAGLNLLRVAGLTQLFPTEHSLPRSRSPILGIPSNACQTKKYTAVIHGSFKVRAGKIKELLRVMRNVL